MNSYKIYCINLERSVDRRKKMEVCAKKANVAIEFVDAIDHLNIKHVSEIKNYDRKKRLKLFKRDLTFGHLAALQSHRKALSLFLDTHADYGIILEDDVDFSENFSEGLKAIMCAPHIDAVRLFREVNAPINKMPFAFNLAPQSSWQLQAASHMSTKALANMYSRAGAKKVLKLTDQFYLAIDRTIIYGFKEKLALYDIKPPIIFKNPDDQNPSMKGFRESRENDKAKRYFIIYCSIMKALWSYMLALRSLKYKLLFLIRKPVESAQ